MNAELLQNTIDVVFKGNLLYFSPFLFILMAVLVAERFRDLILDTIKGEGSTRRSRY